MYLGIETILLKYCETLQKLVSQLSVHIIEGKLKISESKASYHKRIKLIKLPTFIHIFVPLETFIVISSAFLTFT